MQIDSSARNTDTDREPFETTPRWIEKELLLLQSINFSFYANRSVFYFYAGKHD